MKKLLLLATAIFVFYSCTDICENCNQKKEYSFKIYYNCKDKIDTFKWIGHGDNLFRLEAGDLQWCSPSHKSLLSGISRYEVISINKLETATTETNIPAEVKLFNKK